MSASTTAFASLRSGSKHSSSLIVSRASCPYKTKKLSLARTLSALSTSVRKGPSSTAFLGQAPRSLYPLPIRTRATARAFHASTSARMGVHNLGNKADYDKAVEASKTQLMVLDCYATWCGPCKVIAPKIVEFSEEFTNAAFYKLDVDDVPDVAQELSIRAMPTFLLFKNGDKVGEVVGANPNALKTAIKGHYEG